MKSLRERGTRGDTHRPHIRRGGGWARRSGATLGVGAAFVVLMVSSFRATPAAVHSTGETPRQAVPASAAGRSFDVVSIKRNKDPDGPRFFNAPSPGRLSLINQTVRQIIGSSHQLQDYQIIGGPEWLRTDRFDIEATAEGGRTAPQMLVMVRTLLADRFQLKMHPEQRELPVFRLTYARADRRLGPQLTPSQCRPVGAKPDDSQAAVCGNQVGRNVMALRGNTMRGLANQLGRLPIVGRPVIDATGLTDTFDIQLTWAFEPVATADWPDRLRSPMRPRSSQRFKSNSASSSSPRAVPSTSWSSTACSLPARTDR